MALEIILPGTDCILLYLGGVKRSQFKGGVAAGHKQ